MKTIGILRLRDICLLLVLLSLALSCGSDDNGMDCPDPTNANCNPTLSSVAPVTGPKHTQVTITGENFGTDATKVSVSFNGTPGEVLGVTDREVTVKVPVGANTGPITMEVDGFDLTGPKFVYELTYTVETFAGTPGEEGFLDGSGTVAQFNRPYDLVMDSKGNLFVADFGNNAIRKITPSGQVTTFAGDSGGRQGEGNGQFYRPHGLAIDSDDNIYVADSRNHRIVKIVPDGDCSTIAGGGASGNVSGDGEFARFNYPTATLVEEEEGNRALYVSDQNNHAIRKVSLNDGRHTVSTYAGPESIEEGDTNGSLSGARFSGPWGMAKSGEGTILLADYGNHRIRVIDQDAGTVGTFAGGEHGHVGDVPRSQARFWGPTDISMAGDGNIYIADGLNHCIRQIDPDGHVTTIAGNPRFGGHKDGSGDVAEFNFPAGLLYGGEGEIYITDSKNHAIRKITID
ncbi:IPT/TIG domain-containing protein [Flagellimonas algicola]|nr:IPT/TIG domain-containing protein [Allomuricauda algicola]